MAHGSLHLWPLGDLQVDLPLKKKQISFFLFICQSEKLFLSPDNHTGFLLPCSEMFWSSELGGHRQKQRSCSAGLCIPLKQNKVF